MHLDDALLAELIGDVFDILGGADDGADDDDEDEPSPPLNAHALPAAAALACRPALRRPDCLSSRCVAICVCSSPACWDDDDTRSDTTETGDGLDDSLEEVSLFELLELIADYESDVDTDWHHSDLRDRHDEGREEETPSPHLPLPPRKRYLRHTGAAEPAKHGRFGMLEPGFTSGIGAR
mmetsp:Transcript_47720/g.111377  ORF Transcript_47720/g.111377 Transcript_47720/m.111377 type:complete len:180 (+) Transcript_47720:110-649(+)